MTFENFASAQSFLLIAGFVIAFIMGAIVNKTHFCTMGAVSDWINMGHTGRFRAWGLAIGVALTMKVQFYKMMYEGEASFTSALITGLVDLKLLPESLRKHEKV